MARYDEIGELAAMFKNHVTDALTFGHPTVDIEDVPFEDVNPPGISAFRGRLTLSELNNPDLVVAVGYADLLAVDMSQFKDPTDLFLLTAGDLPGAYHLEPAFYYELFDPESKEECIFHRYPRNHLDVVTIVRDLFVDPSFRGNNLGAWMLAEMASLPQAATTLFVGWAHGGPPGRDCDAHWAGLLNVTLLTESTLGIMHASPGLAEARQSLSDALPERFTIAASDLRKRYDEGDTDLWPRSLLMPQLRGDSEEIERARSRFEYQQRLAWRQAEFEYLSAEYKRVAVEYQEAAVDLKTLGESGEGPQVFKKLKELDFQKRELTTRLSQVRRSLFPGEVPISEDSDDDLCADDYYVNDDEVDDEESGSGSTRMAPTQTSSYRHSPERASLTSVSVLTWNVGHRVTRKAIPLAMGEALISLGADVLLLNEFVDGAGDRDLLRAQLRDAGYEYFAISEAPPKHNQVFAASRVPIVVGDIAAPTMDSHAATNFLHLELPGSEIELIGIRAPAYKTAAERRDYWDEIGDILRAAQHRALVVAGDLNLDPFKRVSGSVSSVKFPGIEEFSSARPEGAWSFASLHDGTRNSRIDHVLHPSRIRILEPRYCYEAAGIDLAGPLSPHRGDHAALTFIAELVSADA